MAQDQMESQEIEELKSDKIELRVSREPGCLIRFTILVPEEVVEAGYQQAMKRINKEISIPGFRKGKAPSSMIEKNYAGQIKNEWQDLILNESFQEALRLTNTTPFSRNGIKAPKIETFARGKPAEFSLSFEAVPDVPPVDAARLRVKKVKPKTVTKKQKERALDNLLHEHAEWEEIRDRPVKDKDYIDVDIHSLDEPPHLLTKGTRMWVKKGVMPQWLHALVMGKGVGDVVEGVSEKDDTEEGEETAFRPTRCSVAIKKIWSARLPEENDEFAQKYGVNTMEELHQKIEESLNKNVQILAHREMMNQLEESLLQVYPFDLPTSLVEREKNQRVHAENRRLQQLEYSKEAIQKMQPEMQQRQKELALEELRLAFLLRQVAQEQQLTVTKDELIAELNQELWVRSPEERVVDNSMEPEEIRSRLEVIILNRKAKEWLMDHVSSAA